jgi:hypothetical protein
MTETKHNTLFANTFRNDDEFYTAYANNILLEGSVWDMKLIFGQLDQRTEPPRVEQYGSLTIPWSQAKIFAYLLCIHLAGYELVNGKIAIPNSIMPPEPPVPTEEGKQKDPNLEPFFNRMMWLREQFFGQQKSSQ